MFIKKFCENSKSIIISIPLTTTSGKIRVKQRDSIFNYGLPFASKQKPFNQKNYIEWQISYSIGKGDKNYDKTTLKEICFNNYANSNKALYELSEYLYYFVKWQVIEKQKLSQLKKFLLAINEDNLLDKHPHCRVKRTDPIEKIINELCFNVLAIEYPQLIYKFKQYEIIAEITIREKQRAVGLQPMLYFCFPIKKLHTEKPLIGRCAATKEFAEFIFDKDNCFILLEMIKIFGMLSSFHRRDIIAIIEKIGLLMSGKKIKI